LSQQLKGLECLGDETVDGGPKDNDGAKDPTFQSSPDEPALSRSSVSLRRSIAHLVNAPRRGGDRTGDRARESGEAGAECTGNDNAFICASTDVRLCPMFIVGRAAGHFGS
jgi:hypothetical protein